MTDIVERLRKQLPRTDGPDGYEEARRSNRE